MAFQSHEVSDPSSVARFSAWMVEQGRQVEPGAVAFKQRSGKIAFANRDESWTLSFSGPLGDVSAEVVKGLLLGQQQMLLARNLGQDLVDLARWFSKHFKLPVAEVFFGLAHQYVGDLASSAACINQTVTPASKFKKVEHDAFDVALLEPQYAQGISDYYSKVSIPFARAMAEAALMPGATSWWVSYQYLWVRVLAYFTADPTLTWCFQENRDPFETVAKILKVTPNVAEVLLLLKACGDDMGVFSSRFPDRVDELPDDFAAVSQQFSKSLPNLHYGVIQMQNAYYETREAQTRYGRRLRPGHPLGEAVAFRIFGSVEDAIGVATSTFHLNRPSRNVRVTGLQGGPASNVIRIEGTGPNPEILAWAETLKGVASLGYNSFGSVPLMPGVTIV